MAKIYEIFGEDAHSMTMSLLEAAKVADMIPEGASVALKPNLVIAGTPESGATTHPGVLSGCIEYLQAHGFTDISVIEGSWVGDRTGRAYKVAGYDKVCQKYNVPFYDLKQDETVTVETPLRKMDICKRAWEAGFLINLPVLKGHCQTTMTCALKNCKGCIPDREKRRFHTEGLMKPIAALASALNPDLIIVDSICGDLNFEEGGTPVQTNRMYLGTDPVQIDAYGCRLMGIDLDEVPYIGIAEDWDAGSTEILEDDIIRLNQPQASRKYPAATGLVRQLTKNVQQDSACSACYAALVRGLYVASDNGMRYTGPIAIGQGWKGKEFDGLGIGNCCRNAKCFVKGCPPTGNDVAQAIEEAYQTKSRK